MKQMLDLIIKEIRKEMVLKLDFVKLEFEIGLVWVILFIIKILI
jgi:hypothetical protein